MLGVIDGAHQAVDENGNGSGQLSGLFDVRISGLKKEKVPICMPSYDFRTNEGIIRLPRDGELVLVGRTEEDQYYIISSVTPFSHGENLSESLPVIGSMGRSLKQGEMLFIGSHTKFPDEMSYMLFDKSGGVETRAGYSSLKMAGSGDSSLQTYTFSLKTESGYEKWGEHPLVKMTYPGKSNPPARWERMVRVFDSNNMSSFVLTREGNIVPPGEDFLLSVDAILKYKNYGNQLVEIVKRDGTYIIASGINGPESAKLAYSPEQAAIAAKLAPSYLEISPGGELTIRSGSVIIKGEIEGRPGSITIDSGRLYVKLKSGMHIKSDQQITIEAPSTILSSDVTINGNLLVNGSFNTTFPINLSVPIITAGHLVAPLQFGENIPDK